MGGNKGKQTLADFVYCTMTTPSVRIFQEMISENSEVKVLEKLNNSLHDFKTQDENLGES